MYRAFYRAPLTYLGPGQGRVRRARTQNRPRDIRQNQDVQSVFSAFTVLCIVCPIGISQRPDQGICCVTTRRAKTADHPLVFSRSSCS
jgi:hypothetical protein